MKSAKKMPSELLWIETHLPLKQIFPDLLGAIVEPHIVTRKLLHEEPSQLLALAMAYTEAEACPAPGPARAEAPSRHAESSKADLVLLTR